MKKSGNKLIWLSQSSQDSSSSINSFPNEKKTNSSVLAQFTQNSDLTIENTKARNRSDTTNINNEILNNLINDNGNNENIKRESNDISNQLEGSPCTRHYRKIIEITDCRSKENYHSSILTQIPLTQYQSQESHISCLGTPTSTPDQIESPNFVHIHKNKAHNELIDNNHQTNDPNNDLISPLAILKDLQRKHQFTISEEKKIPKNDSKSTSSIEYLHQTQDYHPVQNLQQKNNDDQYTNIDNKSQIQNVQKLTPPIEYNVSPLLMGEHKKNKSNYPNKHIDPIASKECHPHRFENLKQRNEKNQSTEDSFSNTETPTVAKKKKTPEISIPHSQCNVKYNMHDDIDSCQTTSKPLLSILNVVVDFVMRPPSPLEPYEFQLTRNRSSSEWIDDSSPSDQKIEEQTNAPIFPPKHFILVPVMRIFGPILKWGEYLPDSIKYSKYRNQQNACLHIHNVFPYLLARPLHAGPDGSRNYPPQNDVQNNNNETGAIHQDKPMELQSDKYDLDWNNPSQLRLIVDDIAESLEEMLLSANSYQNHQPEMNQKQSKSIPRSIRQISVVSGRGFYTYCGGPSAPFLKVEYYNPKDRWKVKACLEKGLDINVDVVDHDENKNDDKNTQSFFNSNDLDNTDLPPIYSHVTNIQFRCYEAHIPYTMQAFKDLNLAGMTYIKIREGRFRSPLPRLSDSISNKKHFFGNGNIPENLCWDHQGILDDIKVANGNVSKEIKDGVVKNLFKHCSNENKIDISSNMNVHKSLGSDSLDLDMNEECNFPLGQESLNTSPSSSQSIKKCSIKENIDADPSFESDYSKTNKSTLTEKTMSHEKLSDLNKSKDPDFSNEMCWWMKKETSSEIELDTTTSEILNVLDILTPTNLDNESQAIDESDIYWRAVPSLYELWQEERARMMRLLPPDLNFLNKTSSDDSNAKLEKTRKPCAKQACRGMKKLFNAEENEWEIYHEAMKDILNRYENDIVKEDEEILKDYNETNKTNNIQTYEQVGTPSVKETLQALIALGDQFSKEENITLPCFSPNFMSVDEYESPSRAHIRDSLLSVSSNPHSTMLSGTQKTTTYPFRNRAQKEVILTVEDFNFGRRIDQGSEIEDTDGLVDPETLVPFDFHNEADIDADHKTVEDFEHDLNVLSMKMDIEDSSMDDHGFDDNFFNKTQAFIDEDDIDSIDLESTGSGIQEESGSNGILLSDNNSVNSKLQQNSESISIGNTGYSFGKYSKDKLIVNHKDSSSISENSPPVGNEVDLSKNGNKQFATTLPCNIVIEPKIKAPIRSEWMNTNLFPIRTLDRFKHNGENATLKQDPLFWMGYTGSLQKWKDSIVQGSLGNNCMKQKIKTQTWIEPTKKPPNPHEISSWIRKNGIYDSKDTIPNQSAHQILSSSRSTVPKVKGEHQESNFKIDENSRKLVASNNLKVVTKKRKYVAFHDLSTVCEVEEVDWDEMKMDKSQNYFLTASQNSQVFGSQLIEQATQKKRILQHDRRKEMNHLSKNTVKFEMDVNSRPSSSVDSPGSTRVCENEKTGQLHLQSKSSSKKISSPNLQIDKKDNNMNLSNTKTNSNSPNKFQSYTPHPLGASDSNHGSKSPLKGMGNAGGKLHVEGGGLKANVDPNDNNVPLPTPMSIMSIEIHVQCRTGKAGLHDSKIIAMKPDSSKDEVFAVSYVFARDPGGGEKIQIIEQGCLFRPVKAQLASIQKLSYEENKAMESINARKRLLEKYMGLKSQGILMEEVKSERQLLLRLVSIVQWRDPDALVSWDTQGAGLGYLIERGLVSGHVTNVNSDSGRITSNLPPIDLARLLGRTPKIKEKDFQNSTMEEQINFDAVPRAKEQNNEASNTVDVASKEKEEIWKGSGLGTDWDERVGAGAAVASIVGRIVFCGWKIISEEVKHPNASYQPAVVAAVLQRRLPYHDDLILTRWYGGSEGLHRWRVLSHRLNQAKATVLLFDSLDVIGRAGEAARLSGVEFSQSLPGIRGSQYKVEGVILRALKSVFSDERGMKKAEGLSKFTGQTSTLSFTQMKSQSQSPWKLRRIVNSNKKTCGNVENDSDHEDKSETTKDRAYFFFSPSRDDCTNQEALECQALTLEPQSGFHYDPVVVCDFTALYPSLVIAYNLCYSTCAGKLEYHSTRIEMQQEGRTTGRLGPFLYSERQTATVLNHHMKSLTASGEKSVKSEDRAYITPTASIFVSENVIKGVLPQVLNELLATRAMLKKAAKVYRKNVKNLSPSVLRQLEARQLALKYVANVTYGYTSATFSGRSAMPLLADTIVECGRRTLTNAINLANSWGHEKRGKWSGAHVIYGDTDSLFIKLPNRSVKEAFVFGTEFCEAVTASNPPPIQLKLEKVYAATLLQTKKKYCGMKYESATQKRPVFEAKGIETVRRDQCLLTQKILRNALITSFRKGLNATKEYLERQWALIHADRLPVSDYILTGRVRSQYRGGKMGPVQAALARRLAEADPGRVVRHKERLPYVIVAAPGRNFKLRDCVLTPTELLEQWDSHTIHSTYYATKHVNAALQRCLGLPPYNVNINAWYESCTKPRRRLHFWPVTRVGATAMISSYFGSDICAICGKKCMANGSARAVVCTTCIKNRIAVSALALTTYNQSQQISHSLSKVCERCNGCIENAGTFAVEKGEFMTARNEDADLEDLFGEKKSIWKSSGGVVTPLANCMCIDCPITYERHKARESEMQCLAICNTLQMF